MSDPSAEAPLLTRMLVQAAADGTRPGSMRSDTVISVTRNPRFHCLSLL